MATVYLADDLKHGRRVAIKVMLPELAAAIGRDRFLREIEIAARLTHPHILPLYDSGVADSQLYYVTPFIAGETLRERITREKQLPIEDAIRLAREIASALGYAHHQGIVHRDIKPGNILLADNIALVADFGIARAIATGAVSETDATAAGGLTSPGMMVGTPRYMAPEQAAGKGVDARADLYALGCVLYAAARVKILSPAQIRSKLDDRFRLLTGGSKTALPRHQTLRATLQWSYDQLSEDEQRLFRQLSVFAGGSTLDLATRVAGKSSEFEVMDILAHLVDKSLVVVEKPPDADSRYGLFETVRQFAQERLTESGQADDTRQRHFEAFLALAEEAYKERINQEEKWARALESDHDNLRAALEVARHNGPGPHLQMAGALAWFWQVRSHFIEAREHLTEALAASPTAIPHPARARALWGVANTITWQGDGAKALPLMEEALQMWRDLGDAQEVAIALEGTGWAQLHGGNNETACATFRELLKIQREGGDLVLINRAMVALGQALVVLEQLDEARKLSHEIVAFSRSRGDRRNEQPNAVRAERDREGSRRGDANLGHG